jgi:hypothetical protein
MGALCSCLGGDSPKESKEPNNQAPGAVVNTSEPSSRAGLAAIRRWVSFSVFCLTIFCFLLYEIIARLSAKCFAFKKTKKKPSSAVVFRLCDQIWGPCMLCSVLIGT